MTIMEPDRIPRAEKSREQNLQDGINRDAGMVRIDALVAYLESVRAGCTDALLARGCEDADWYRGRYAACRDLLTVLTTQPPAEGT